MMGNPGSQCLDTWFVGIWLVTKEFFGHLAPMANSDQILATVNNNDTGDKSNRFWHFDVQNLYEYPSSLLKTI